MKERISSFWQWAIHVSSVPRQLVSLVAVLALIIVLARYTPLDHALTGLFYDSGAHRFPLRDQPFWAVIMHTGLKYLSLVLWLILLLGWIRVRDRPSLQPLRQAMAFTLMVMPLASLTVSLFRAISPHSCPWDLILFGGVAEYFRFFDSIPANPGPGRCVPSGHASAGFAWLAAYVAMRHVNRYAAQVALGFVVLFGTLASVTQIVRGAHFLSHVLLTAWICFVVAWLSDLAYGLWKARHR